MPVNTAFGMVMNRRCTALTGLQQSWNLAKQILYRPPLLGMENVPGFRIDSILRKVLPSLIVLHGHGLALLNSLSLIHSGRRLPEAPPGRAAPSGTWDLCSHCRRGKVRPKNQGQTFHFFSLQVRHISSAHNSVARTNHLVSPNWTGCSKYRQGQIECMSKTKSTTQSVVGRKVLVPCSFVLATICDYDTGSKRSHCPGRALSLLWFYLMKGVELSTIEMETPFIWSMFLGRRTSPGIRLLASSPTPDWLLPTAKSGDGR